MVGTCASHSIIATRACASASAWPICARVADGRWCTRWQRAREVDHLAGDRRRRPNAAAQLPQRRGVVGRRRAGRRRWMAR